MGFKGFHRFAGVIESDYTGLWGVVIYNSNYADYWLPKEKAIAQVVFQQVWMGEPREGKVNRETDRGEAGFGSTDKPTRLRQAIDEAAGPESIERRGFA
jgi:dUTPase